MKETILTFSCKIATNEYLMNCKEHIYNHFFLKNVFFIKSLQIKKNYGIDSLLESGMQH